MTAIRKRAPSARSLETRKRILDASEKVFSEQGFNGSSLREIATLADVPVGLVQHHGVNKETLFCQTVRRRTEELATIRLHDLEHLKSDQNLTLKKILTCFFGAYVKLIQTDGDQWFFYGRLVAHVSADVRWQALATECFDPTTHLYLTEILKLYPKAAQHKAATGQIYSVAAMLAFFNSTWRIDTLSPDAPEASIDDLVIFCAAGMDALLTAKSA